jgi:uncharacterized membrane protein YeaQ/YmgE (transglycosylase-associated protein family)
MEILRHPLYSVLAVIVIGAVCGAAAHCFGPDDARPRALVLVLAAIGAAFLGFHFAMLSNVATDVIWMPFSVAFAVALVASFVLGKA